MAPRKTTKPAAKKATAKKPVRRVKPVRKVAAIKPAKTRVAEISQEDLDEIKKARRDARRQGKGAFQGKARAGVTGGVKKSGYDKVVAQAIADSKTSKTVLRDGTVVRNESDQTELQKRAANRRAATRDAVSSVEKRNVAKAGKDVAKQLAARREAAVYEAYIRGRESGLSVAEAKRESVKAGEAFDRAEKTKAEGAKKAVAKKTTAKKTAKNPLTDKSFAAKNASTDKAVKATPKAKATPKPPAGETPKNASGAKPAGSVSQSAAAKKVQTFTSQIQDVETEMKNNRAALRAGTMTQAQVDAEKAKLTAKKNELMKARTAVAKQAGISIADAKAQEGSRPARNPQSPAKKATAKKATAKKTSAKVVKVDNTKAIRAVDTETAKVLQDYKDKRITRSQMKAKLAPLTSERARLLNGGKPVGSSVSPSSGVRTRAEGVGRSAKTTGSRALVVPKANQTAVTKATGLTWEKAGSRMKGFLGRGLFGKAMAVLTVTQVADLVAGLISDTGIVEKGFIPQSAQSGGMSLPYRGTPGDPLGIKGGGKGAVKPKPPVSKKPEYPNIPNKYPAPKPAAPKKDYKGYRVKSGDTMWDIAKDNGVTLEQLYKANPIIAKRTASGKVDIFANSLVRIPKK